MLQFFSLVPGRVVTILYFTPLRIWTAAYRRRTPVAPVPRSVNYDRAPASATHQNVDQFARSLFSRGLRGLRPYPG